MTGLGFDQPFRGEPGRLILSSRAGRSGPRLHVDRADPRIWIRHELLHDLIFTRPRDRHRDLTVTLLPHATDMYAGVVITIDAVNQRVVYVTRPFSYLAPLHVVEAQWPD